MKINIFFILTLTLSIIVVLASDCTKQTIYQMKPKNIAEAILIQGFPLGAEQNEKALAS